MNTNKEALSLAIRLKFLLPNDEDIKVAVIRIAEQYADDQTAALSKEVEELRECFKDLHIFCLENGEVVNGFRSKEIIQKSKNLLK